VQGVSFKPSFKPSNQSVFIKLDGLDPSTFLPVKTKTWNRWDALNYLSESYSKCYKSDRVLTIDVQQFNIKLRLCKAQSVADKSTNQIFNLHGLVWA